MIYSFKRNNAFQTTKTIMFKDEIVKQLKLFIKFVNTDMTVRDYLKAQKPLNEEVLKKSQKISIGQLKKMKAFWHEMAHYNVWKKYGVKANFYICKDTKQAFIKDVDFVSRAMVMNKEKVIEIYKEVLIAPYNQNRNDKGVTTDLIYYEIISGNIKRIPTKKDISMINNKYGLR